MWESICCGTSNGEKMTAMGLAFEIKAVWYSNEAEMKPTKWKTTKWQTINTDKNVWEWCRKYHTPESVWFIKPNSDNCQGKKSQRISTNIYPFIVLYTFKEGYIQHHMTFNQNAKLTILIPQLFSMWKIKFQKHLCTILILET